MATVYISDSLAEILIRNTAKPLTETMKEITIEKIEKEEWK